MGVGRIKILKLEYYNYLNIKNNICKQKTLNNFSNLL